MDFVTFLYTLLVSFAAALAFMTVVFLIGRRLGRFDIVDSAWGLTFIVIALTAVVFNTSTQWIDQLVVSLVVIWGLRLSAHIFRRFRTSNQEDRRYVEMRKKWNAKNVNQAIYGRIFATQAGLAVIVSLPVIFVASSDAVPITAFVIIGGLAWAIGFIVEVLADVQLRRFVQDPNNKGKLMTAGVWRYSRHPNYFGEFMLWWGIGIIAIGLPFGWIALLGPIVISYLLLFVSGVPPTEKAFSNRPGWDDYKAQTSVFVPWITKKNRH